MLGCFSSKCLQRRRVVVYQLSTYNLQYLDWTTIHAFFDDVQNWVLSGTGTTYLDDLYSNQFSFFCLPFPHLAI